jgi:serine/threonine protein kinase
MISRLNALHSRGIVHCDIKPCNMMLGLGEKQKRVVYLVDFGLSNEFSEGDLPAQEKKRASIEGTPEFASANAHRGLI